MSTETIMANMRCNGSDSMLLLMCQGLCKNIGVSNFGIDHIEHLLDQATITPAVNQIELSPFLQRKELVDYCRSKNIVLEVMHDHCRCVCMLPCTLCMLEHVLYEHCRQHATRQCLCTDTLRSAPHCRHTLLYAELAN